MHVMLIAMVGGALSIRPTTHHPASMRCTSTLPAGVTDRGEPPVSRRLAVLAGLTSAASVSAAYWPASPALADDTDDMVARIAAKNALAVQKERDAAGSIDGKTAEQQSEEGKGLVGTFLLGSVVLSVPFYFKK